MGISTPWWSQRQCSHQLLASYLGIKEAQKMDSMQLGWSLNRTVKQHHSCSTWTLQDSSLLGSRAWFPQGRHGSCLRCAVLNSAGIWGSVPAFPLLLSPSSALDFICAWMILVTPFIPSPFQQFVLPTWTIAVVSSLSIWNVWLTFFALEEVYEL